MRNRIFALLAATYIILTALPLEAKAAELPACTVALTSLQDEPFSASDMPKQIALSREIELYSSYPSVNLSISTAGEPNAALTVSSDNKTWHLTPTKETGELSLVVQYESYETIPGTFSQRDCYRTQTLGTEVIEGIDPEVTVRKTGRNNQEIDIAIAEYCPESKLGKLTLSLKEGRNRVTYSLDDLCDGQWARDSAKATHKWWGVYSYLPKEDPDSFSIYLRNRSQSKKIKLNYAIKLGKEIIARGKLLGETRYKNGKKIWESTDAFVNYCINERRAIYSQGGVLYCNKPGSSVRKWKIK